MEYSRVNIPWRRRFSLQLLLHVWDKPPYLSEQVMKLLCDHSSLQANHSQIYQGAEQADRLIEMLKQLCHWTQVILWHLLSSLVVRIAIHHTSHICSVLSSWMAFQTLTSRQKPAQVCAAEIVCCPVPKMDHFWKLLDVSIFQTPVLLPKENCKVWFMEHLSALRPAKNAQKCLCHNSCKNRLILTKFCMYRIVVNKFDAKYCKCFASASPGKCLYTKLWKL